MITIFAPNKAYNGRHGRVAFTNGQATIDEQQMADELAYFQRAGYGIGVPIGHVLDQPLHARTERQGDAPGGPWWQHRKPATDAERLELAGLQFTMDPGLERLVAVEEHVPEALPLLTHDRRAELAAYVEKRNAKLARLGQRPPDADPAMVAQLKAAAAAMKQARAPQSADVDREYRARFLRAVRLGEGDPLDVWRQWAAAIEQERRELANLNRQRAVLGLGPWRGPTPASPVYASELDRATGGSTAPIGAR